MALPIARLMKSATCRNFAMHFCQLQYSDRRSAWMRDSVMSDRNAIEIHRLSKAFGDTLAVDDVSFAVRPGELFGFMGHNGAGNL
jgi:ABC-type polysaccharide/polyol phosphate transport system ATPase subunit